MACPSPHPHRALRRALPAALCVLLLAACQSGGEDEGAEEGPTPPSFEPVVFPHQRPRQGEDALRDTRRPDEDAAGWREKWELASRYAAGGFDAEALQVLDAALANDPPSPWAERMRNLKTSLRVRRAEEVLLRVDARGVKDYVPFGADVDFVIRLRNVSPEVVTLLAPQAGEDQSSPSAMVLEVTRRDRDIHATELTRRWTQTVFIQRTGAAPIRIAPGGAHEIEVRIPAEDAGPPLSGLRVIEVGGTLRPTRLRRGREPRTVRLPIRTGRVVALPAGFEPLVGDPLASMRTAHSTMAPAHLLVATEFVPPGRRVEAVGILAAALADGHPRLARAALGGLAMLRERAIGEPLAPFVRPLVDALARAPRRAEALMEGLSAVSGVRLAPDPRLWQDWWRREAERRTAIAPRSEDSSGS